MILVEMIHDVRIIPLDGRPQLPQNVRQWTGSYRGRWEGETLVVETTNFNGKNPFQGSSEHMRLIERFTRVDQDTIRYQFTVDDPSTWTKPWSAEVPWAKAIGPLFEHACHEGNYGLGNILAGARVETSVPPKWWGRTRRSRSTAAHSSPRDNVNGRGHSHARRSQPQNAVERRLESVEMRATQPAHWPNRRRPFASVAGAALRGAPAIARHSTALGLGLLCRVRRNSAENGAAANHASGAARALAGKQLAPNPRKSRLAAVRPTVSRDAVSRAVARLQSSAVSA